MRAKWLPTLIVSMGIVGCGSSTETPGSGGAANSAGGTSSVGGGGSGGSSAGSSATGGSPTGGSPTGGTTSGGSANAGSGGQPSGGAGAGGDASGGMPAGGSAGAGGDGGSGGGAGDVKPSQGCNVSDGLDKLTTGGQSVMNGLPTSVKLSIMSGNMNREYIIDVPENYDPSHPYRVVFSWHQAYGSATGNANGQYPANNGPNFDAQNYAYFGLLRESKKANDPTIFVAPQGIGNLPWDYARDVALFDALLARIGENLCIDESRVFTTGFSFGAMMSHALSISRQDKLRGAVTMAPANYNLPNAPQSPSPGKMAYFGITGMSDGTCPWVNNDAQKRGGKYCVLTHAETNGCTANVNIPTAMNGSKSHVCYDFEGCDEGYPVKVCTFDGGHTPSSISDGMSGGDDGLKAFVPPLAWQFISQF
jgi:poly(3-hydroxybutyrate) depolymerase